MRRLIRDESGATAIIVALLLVVLVGMTAFIVDIGDVMWERRMLQNSSDAAALAVAIDCAQGDCLDYQSTADEYATENNVRGAFVQSVTGPDGLPPTFAGGEVTVVTRTGDTSGEGRLQQWFSGVLGQEEGLATGASATAIWGVPDLTTSASPLTISVCAFQRLTGITNWPPTDDDIKGLPTYEDSLRENDEVIYYKDGPKQEEALDEGCKAPPGFYSDPDAEEGTDDKLPSAFAWLESSECEVTITNELGEDGSKDQWAPAKSGASAGGEVACVKDLVNQEPPVAIFPIFVGVREDNKGAPQEYQIVTAAAFFLTGYSLPGGGGGLTYPAGDVPCTPEEGTCIRGQFVKKLEKESPTNKPGFGLISVRLSE